MPGEPLRGQDQRDVHAGRGELLETRARVRGGSQAHDAVVTRVPVLQLPLDRAQRLRVVVDREQNRQLHETPFYGTAPARHPRSHSPVRLGRERLGVLVDRLGTRITERMSQVCLAIEVAVASTECALS